MGEAIDNFLKTSSQAIEDMRAGRYSTMSMTVLHEAIAELATRIQVLEEDKSETVHLMTEMTRLVKEMGAMARATHDITVDNSKRIIALARGGGNPC